MTHRRQGPLRAGLLGLLLCASPAFGQADSTATEDGWPDISDFLDSKVGFLPVVVPITEPAVGYGAVFGPTFIKRPEGGGRPDITVLAGLATENGTWGALAGDSRNWLDGRLQTLVGVLYASVNLDYYGIGEGGALADSPLRYNLAPLGGVLQLKYRLGNSRFWGGLGYVLSTIDVGFDAPAGTPSRPDFENTARLGGVGPSLSYDTRDNIFTPLRGMHAELSAGLFGPALGGEDEFQRVQLSAMKFIPLPSKLSLGLRGRAMSTFGDPPFYLFPYVDMRGVQAVRYQGQSAAQLESELRWQCWKRFSAVGFVGLGTAWNDLDLIANEEVTTVVAGGPGVRYEIARRHGIHAGIDVGFGPDDPAFYVTVGSAWMKP